MAKSKKPTRPRVRKVASESSSSNQAYVDDAGQSGDVSRSLPTAHLMASTEEAQQELIGFLNEKGRFVPLIGAPEKAASGSAQSADAQQVRVVSEAPLTDRSIRTPQELLEYLDDLGGIPLGKDSTLPTDAKQQWDSFLLNRAAAGNPPFHLSYDDCPHWWETFLHKVYSLMHRLGITWTPTPPYGRLEYREAEDELARIRARLRADVGDNNQQLPTIWFHGNQSYSLDGKTPVKVSREQHTALSAFLDKDVALDTDALFNAGISNVSKVLDALGKRFPGAVHKPAAKGHGYFIRVKSLTATK